MQTGILLATVVLALAGQGLSAQGPDTLPPGDPSHEHSRRPIVAAAATSGRIRVDGRLSDADWDRATPVSRFVQVEPNTGAEPRERTEVRFLVSDDALFVGARMFDSRAAEIRRRLTRRDDNAVSDRLTVSLDPFHNHRTAVRFTVTAAGSIADATIGARLLADASWDPVWEAATTIDDQGWTAELRIPLSQLRYAAGGDAWGIQVERFTLRTQERDALAFVSPNERSIVENFGHLTGVQQLTAKRHVELLPYVSQRSSFLSAPSTSPLSDARQHTLRAGADIRYSLSSNLTLNASVNPDFGQVEVDPAVVNLTVFETVFPEKRPFFVEGAEFFEFGRLRAYNAHPFPQSFFSRRIGRAPQLAPPNVALAAATDVPEQTDILVASKLTGRSASGWSLGALHSLTCEASARTLDSDGRVSSGVVEPMTNVAVVRASRDFGAGRTTLGALATSIDRRLDDSSTRYLRSSARVAGVDLRHTWGNRTWALDGDFSASSVSGSASAIALTQRSSVHYFQRPDRSDARFDPTRTSLSGYAGELALTKLRGSWVGNVAYQDVSPGFEVNDVGLEQSAGRRMFSTDLHYQRYTPGRLFNNFIIWPFTNHQWNYDGEPLQNVGLPTYNFWFQGQFRNFWSVVLWSGYTPRFVDDRLTRGGPAGSSRRSRFGHIELKSSDRGAVAVTTLAETDVQEGGGQRTTLGASLSWRPLSNAFFRINPTLTTQRDPSQFIQRIGPASSLVAPVGGALFGRLDRRTIAVDTRAEWTFTPKLSLQTYVQPFIDKGRFDDFAQLRTPRSLEYQVFGKDVGTLSRSDGTLVIDPDASGPSEAIRAGDPNYTVRSVRGNAVLRWEYRPGSTLYVVWQQQPGGQGPSRDLRSQSTISANEWLPSDQVILVKASFWFAF